MSIDERRTPVETGRSRDGGNGRSTRDPDSLLRIAEAVANREDIDWDSELLENPEQQGAVRGLRAIQAIASSCEDPFAASATPLLVTDVPTADLPAPPQTWRHLEIVEPLGEGAFATVFRARDSTLQRDVALKLPKKLEDKDRFLHEVRRLAKIRHPNIVEVHGAEEHEGRVGMWMDLLEGSSLEECLSRQGPFSAGEAAVVGIDLCRALAAVHLEGLVHRDLKAANVMREKGGRIVLMDFSSVVERAGECAVEDDSSTHGTPLYMAPELLAGREATRASDVYSLGVLLYRLVSGRYPVEAKNLQELARKLRQREIKRLGDVRPDLPANFLDVIDQAVAINPQERFRTAGDMEHALSSFAPTTPQPADSSEATAKPNRSRRWATAAAALVVLLGLAWGVSALLPAPLSIDAALFRIGEQANERLETGALLAVGDLLFLELEATRPVYTYVLNEDSMGERHVLFPLAQLELRNPLPAGVGHTLPGPMTVGEGGENKRAEWAWKVDSAGGEEFFMVLASAHALEDLEDRVAVFGPVLRGIGGIEPRPTRPGVSLDDLSQKLKSEHGPDLWIWKIRLGNPWTDGGG